MGLSIDDLEDEYVDALLRLATVFDVAAAAASGEARSAADLPWQPPVDVGRLSAAIEESTRAFWKGLLSGRLGSRLGSHAATVRVRPAP